MAAPDLSARRRRLTALRLVAQRVGEHDYSTPVDVVRWMLALQAQDLPGVKWSVGLRQAAGSVASVDAALDAGEVARSWPLRGTMHLVANEDLRWLLALTTPRAITATARRRAALGLTASDLERAREIVGAALSGGRAQTRRTLLATLEAAGVSAVGQRGYHLLWYLAQTGTLVLGPTHGAQQSFVLLDEWVPHPARHVERDEALGELALRYFRGHGPATERDLARWSGLTITEVRRGLAVCGARLATREIDGITYHLAPETVACTARVTRVHLLPGFDEYLLGYGDRSAALAPEYSALVVPGGNGMFKPTIVADGLVVGTWKGARSAREVVVDAAPFERLAAAVERGLEQAVQAYGAFLGRPARQGGP
jgi:hypothetical protein